MTSLIYNTGTVTVSNGSAVVTGNLTGWAVALVTGGLLSVGGVTVPIASVESDTSLTLAYGWPGSSGSGKTYAIARQPSEATARAATWTVDRLAKLAQTPWGVGVIPDGRGTLAERDAVTPLPNDDYCWLRVEVDQPAELYFRDGGVWLGPYALKGEAGEAGQVGEGLTPMGAWSAATTYEIGQYVTYSGRSFASLQDGNLNHQPPASATDDAYWMFVPSAGGDFVGPASSVDGEVVLFNGTTGKLGKRGPLLDIAPRVPVNDGSPVTVDFDTITTPGWYNRLLSDDGAVHGPGVASRFYFVQVIETAGGNLTQEAHPYRATTEKFYIRSRFSGTWSAWKQLAYADESATAAQGAKADSALQPAAIGSTVQGYDALLAAIAGLTTANGKFLAFTGADTPAVRDIVGTVAQSGGIPTGAIVEGGSNANGVYVRFADGTQICFGSITSSASADVTWTFPAAFVANPSQCGSGVGTGTTNVRSLTTSSVNTTSLALRVVDATNTRVAATASVLAAGRWF